MNDAQRAVLLAAAKAPYLARERGETLASAKPGGEQTVNLAQPGLTEPGPEPKAAPPVLSPNAPFDTAKVFVERQCREAASGGLPVVQYWQGQFWRWNGRVYAPEPEEVIRGQVYAFLDGAHRPAGLGQPCGFSRSPGT
jgi:hypothetical protein